jgi:hypothetical protein
LFFTPTWFFFLLFLGVFQQSGVQKHQKNVLKKIDVENVLQKLRKKIDFVFFRNFYIAFLVVPLHGEFKTPKKPKNESSSSSSACGAVQKGSFRSDFRKYFNGVFGLFMQRNGQKRD